MLSREDVIDNLKFAISDNCTENLANFREEIEFAINDLQKMEAIRKHMNNNTKFCHMIEDLWRSNDSNYN